MHLDTYVSGVHLTSLMMNAAGTCKTFEEVERLANDNGVGAVMVGSITEEPRKGNNERSLFIPLDAGYSLNCMGLPNPGAEYYREHLPEMVSLAHSKGKKLFVSVAGFSAEEYARLTEMAFEAGADFVELNLSCANTEEGLTNKRVINFDMVSVHAILTRIKLLGVPHGRISVKIAPHSDPMALKKLILNIVDFDGLVGAVTAVNTFPNATSYAFTGHSWIGGKDNNGLGALGGKPLKPIALGHVRQIRDMMGDKLAIIGVGGISNADDVVEYLYAGASAVQVATAFLSNRAAFTNITSALRHRELRRL